MNLKQYLDGATNDSFANCWLNNDPFAPDMKSMKTHWHDAPLHYPRRKDTCLWVMDDWRALVIILKSNLETYNRYYKGT